MPPDCNVPPTPGPAQMLPSRAEGELSGPGPIYVQNVSITVCGGTNQIAVGGSAHQNSGPDLAQLDTALRWLAGRTDDLRLPEDLACELDERVRAVQREVQAPAPDQERIAPAVESLRGLLGRMASELAHRLTPRAIEIAVEAIERLEPGRFFGN